MLLRKVSDYLSLIKFSHTIFALPFAAIGFLAGAQSVDFEFERWLVVHVLLCMIFARSAAMAFNRWADRHIDSLNERTKVREIPAGIIESQYALSFALLNCGLFVATTWFINQLCFYLSPVALAVILGYSYTKRFTPYSHLVLGVGLSLAPIGSYLAVTGQFAFLPVLFSVAVVTWVGGFDIIYSLQDEEFDKKNRLYSIPSEFGSSRALAISAVMHVITSLVLLAAYFWGSLGWIYLAGWGIFTGLLIFQHTLVKPGDLSRVNAAFFTTNGVASVLFSIAFAADLFIPL
jgi:4-hydroxybenzoate polyprenyltransferase